ncbi:hypothetical protein BDR26DRAFT_110703 [Obelidium mucronatum]|nr:hypothetical protein BDR26DRAFT_110703 [Obelidium mucronatum]
MEPEQVALVLKTILDSELLNIQKEQRDYNVMMQEKVEALTSMNTLLRLEVDRLTLSLESLQIEMNQQNLNHGDGGCGSGSDRHGSDFHSIPSNEAKWLACVRHVESQEPQDMSQKLQVSQGQSSLESSLDKPVQSRICELEPYSKGRHGTLEIESAIENHAVEKTRVQQTRKISAEPHKIDTLVLEEESSQISVVRPPLSEKPSLQTLPAAIITRILCLLVSPLQGGKNCLKVWHNERRYLYRLSRVSRFIQENVPNALHLVDIRDICNSTQNSRNLVGDQYRRRLYLKASTIASEIDANYKMLGDDTLPFELIPSETVYSHTSHRFRPARLPSLDRGPSIFCISTVYNAATIDFDASHQISMALCVDIDSTLCEGSLNISLSDDVVKTGKISITLHNQEYASLQIRYRVRRDMELSMLANPRFEKSLSKGFNGLLRRTAMLPWYIGKFGLQAMGVLTRKPVVPEKISIADKITFFEQWLREQTGQVTIVSKIIILEVIVPFETVFGGFSR